MSFPIPLLSSLVLVPLAGAALITTLPKNRNDVLKGAAWAICAVELALCGVLLWNFEVGEAGYQFTSQHLWIKPLGVSWNLGIDGISLWLVLLAGLLFPIAVFGPKVDHDLKPYLAWLFVLQAGVMGSFMALDLLLFFICFEIVIVPVYFLIEGWGYADRGKAAVEFFLYTMFGSAFLFVSILGLVWLHQADTGIVTFDLQTLGEWNGLSSTAATLLFFGFAIGFGVKTPVVPLHTWLPDAHTQAPTAGSVDLAGLLLKLGTYGYVRFALFLFPVAAVDWSWLLLTVGTVGIIYGAVVAAMQRDLKRLVAYSSIAHMGFVIIGIFAINSQALTGAVLVMVNHGIATGALFLIIGMIYQRLHTRQISELKGLWSRMPVIGAAMLLVVMASIGVPGLNGFVGEFLVLVGTFMTHRWWAVVAATGVILAAVYALWAFQRTFMGKAPADAPKVPDMTLHEKLTLAPLLILVVLFGIFPKPMIDRIEPSVDQLLTHISEETGKPVSGVSTEATEAKGAE